MTDVHRRERACFITVLTLLASFIVVGSPEARATTPGHPGIIAAAKHGDIVYLDPLTGALTKQPDPNVRFEQDPAWSPTGDWLALGMSGEVAVMRSDGSDTQRFEQAGTAGGWDLSPSWHPDGVHFIYVDAGGRLWSINRDGSEQTNMGTSNVNGAAYSPDGLKIALGGQDLDVMDANGGNRTTLLALDGTQRAPDWSPDGSHIVFQSQGPEGWDIWIVAADGTGATVLAPDAANDVAPTWSPDGSRILFQSSRGAGGLFTMTPAGTEVTRLPGSEGLAAPSWQPEVIGLRASRSVIDAGDAVSFQITLAHPAVQPDVTVQRRAIGGSWKTTWTVPVPPDGVATLALHDIDAITDFRAVWSGDETHPPSTSFVVRIDVRAVVTGRLIRYQGTAGGYRLYHTGRLAYYVGKVHPDLDRDKLCFTVQRRDRRWHEIGFDCFPLGSNSTVTVYTGPFPAGTRLRIHAEFDDRDHLRDISSWSQFRYVA